MSTRPSKQQFNGGDRRAARSGATAGGCRDADDAAAIATEHRRVSRAAEQSVKDVRAEAVALVKEVTGDYTYNDVNYVFPTFIVTQLPVGLVGLLMAAIFAAAMSTIAGELSALSTATVIDFYRAGFATMATRAHLLMGVEDRDAVLGGVRVARRDLGRRSSGSLIEVVNRFGSFFYGSILGVFLLAIGWKRANSTGAFVGLDRRHERGRLRRRATRTIAFLWHNLIGAVVVFGVGMIVSELTGNREPGTGNR